MASKYIGKIKRSRITRQFITLLVGRVGAAALQAITLYLLARFSAPAQFGLISAALGISVLLQAIGDAGTSTFMVREAALNGLDFRIRLAEQFSRTIIYGVAVLGSVFIILLGVFFQEQYFNLLPLAAWLIFERVSEIKIAVARGLGDVKIGTVNLLLRRALQLVLFCLTMLCRVNATLAFSLSACLAAMIALWVSTSRLPKVKSIRPSIRGMTVAFIHCKPYWVHSVTLQARNIDNSLVAFLSGAVQAGYYGVGARLMSPLRMLPTTLATALLPNFVGHGDIERQKKLTMLISLLISLPYLAIIPLSPVAIKIFLGPSYAEATLPLQIMSVGLALSASTSIITALLQAQGHASSVSHISAVSSIILLGLVCLGSIFANAIGAACGLAIGMTMQFFLLVYQVVKL